MPQSSKQIQEQQVHNLQMARWPILAKRYSRSFELVSEEAWTDLEEQLTEERRRMQDILSSKGISERDADELRGGIGVINWLLRLKEDVKEFPR